MAMLPAPSHRGLVRTFRLVGCGLGALVPSAVAAFSWSFAVLLVVVAVLAGAGRWLLLALLSLLPWLRCLFLAAVLLLAGPRCCCGCLVIG